MNGALRRLGSLIGLCAAVYVGLCAMLFFTQRGQIYFPTPERGNAPGLVLENDGVTLRVATRERAGQRAVIYFGGNAEDVSFSLHGLSEAFPEAAIFAAHYRGYGGSEGRPSEAALVADGIALLEHVRARHPGITVIGRSLGSGVAVQVAAGRAVERLVLVTPFDSLVEVAAGHFPLLPVRLLLRDRYESIRYARDIDALVTVIVAGADRIVPPAHGLRLAEAFRATQRHVVVLEQVGHNDIDADPRYRQALRGQ